MPDNYCWDDRHRLMVVAKDADEVERAAMLYGTAPVSSGIDDEKLSGALPEVDDVETYGEAGTQVEDRSVEGITGSVHEEIERRAAMMGEAYPFTLSGGALSYVGSSTGVYEFCLATSLANDLTRRPLNKLPVLFEVIAAEAFRLYLSPEAQSVRTGWPSHDRKLRPTKFKALFGLIANQTLEWVWAPTHPNPDDPDHNTAKDEGVDFVVWRGLEDSRCGQIFILGQCACGRDDWDAKLEEVSHVRLGRWFRPPTFAQFLRAYAIPRHVPGWHVFAYLNERAGVTFDRARISIIAHKNDSCFKPYRDFMNSGIEMVFGELGQQAA